MKLETVVGTVGCSGGECPTIYRTDRNTFVIQGNLVNSSDVTDLQVPSHEGLVEIPETLVQALASKLASVR
jgi:hypothetical protein